MSEGDYEVQIQIYGNSSLTFASTTREQCIDVPSSGVGGVFGAKQQECFSINVPEQIISTVLIGGGKGSSYFSEYNLKNTGEVILNVESMPVPRNIEELQKNYLSFESQSVGVSLR